MSDDANALTLFLLASGDNGSRASLTNDAPSLLALSDAISARRASFSAFADQALARASSSAALIVAALALDDIAFAFARPSSTREHRCAKRSVDTVSGIDACSGARCASNATLASPPKLSARSLVSFEFRKGTCARFSSNAATTSPSALRLLLMCCASFK